MTKPILISLFSICLIVFSPVLIAQPASPDNWVISVNAGLANQSEADLDNSDGAFSADRWFASVGLDYQWDFRNALGLSVGTGRSDYSFDNASGLPVIGPWGEIEDLRVSVISRFAINDQVTGLFIPSVRYNHEQGASSSDGRTWGVLAGASWRLREGLSIGPGIGIFSRLEESTLVIPILVIDWDINERWNLSTGRGLAASQGPGLTLSYSVNEAWTLGIIGRFEQIDFRLDQNGPVPGGIGRDEAFPLLLSAQWMPHPNLELSVFGGAEFGGSLILADQFGETISETDYDTSAVFGGTFRFRF